MARRDASSIRGDGSAEAPDSAVPHGPEHRVHRPVISTSAPCLRVVMYHYVRDLPKTLFPRLKGMMPDAFAMQIANLQRRYEVATLEAALDFLAGRYRPARDLVLLTFDDGLKEHFAEVTPLL